MFTASGATLPASDMGRAKGFYREALGLEPFQEDPDGSARYQLGDTVFAVYPSEFAGTNKATAMALMVEDLEAAVSTLRGRGVEFQELDFEDMKTQGGILEFPDGSKGAFFADSEGNIIGVVQDA